MNLGQNYYTVEAKMDGDFKPLPVGGYVCKILGTQDMPEKQYLIVYFDIAEGEHKDYFSKQKQQFNSDKWPSGGITYRSYKEDNIGYFKGFIKTVEASNGNFNFERAGMDTDSLKGQFMGVVFGEEEYLNQYKELKTSIKARKITTVAKINRGEFTVPDKKTLSEKDKAELKHIDQASYAGFTEVNDAVLPF